MRGRGNPLRKKRKRAPRRRVRRGSVAGWKERGKGLDLQVAKKGRVYLNRLPSMGKFPLCQRTKAIRLRRGSGHSQRYEEGVIVGGLGGGWGGKQQEKIDRQRGEPPRPILLQRREQLNAEGIDCNLRVSDAREKMNRKK